MIASDDDELRAAWRHFKDMPFPTVKRSSTPQVDRLIDVILDFEAVIAGRIDGLVAGSTAVTPDQLTVPAELGAAISQVEALNVHDPVAAATLRYAHELVGLVDAAQEAAIRAGR